MSRRSREPPEAGKGKGVRSHSLPLRRARRVGRAAVRMRDGFRMGCGPRRLLPCSALDPAGPAGGRHGARAGERWLNAGDVDADGADDVARRRAVRIRSPRASPAACIIVQRRDRSAASGAPRRHRQQERPTAIRRASAPRSHGSVTSGAAPSRGASCTVRRRSTGPPRCSSPRPAPTSIRRRRRTRGSCTCSDGATGASLKEIRLSAAERPLSAARIRKAVRPLPGSRRAPDSGASGPARAAGVRRRDRRRRRRRPARLRGRRAGLHGDSTASLGCRIARPCPGVGRVYVVLGEAIIGLVACHLHSTSTRTDRSACHRSLARPVTADHLGFGSALDAGR